MPPLLWHGSRACYDAEWRQQRTLHWDEPDSAQIICGIVALVDLDTKMERMDNTNEDKTISEESRTIMEGFDATEIQRTGAGIGNC